MNLRARFVAAVAVVTLATLGGAFGAVSVAVNRSEQRQLDDALLAAARDEAREAGVLGDARLPSGERVAPTDEDVGPRTDYAALYAHDGRVLAATPSFHGRAPARSALDPRVDGAAFDLWAGREHLRGVLVAVPGQPGESLLFAASRADRDGDARFLARAMLLVFAVAVAWTVLVASWVVRRLTRDHQAIASVARRVADGDLAARVGERRGDAETAQLARDVDAMIARIEVLLAAQQRFIAHASHELRSPLTTLHGELWHALRRPRDAAEYRAAIEEAYDSTRRLKALAEDLLELARVGASREPRAERVAARALVDGAVALVAKEARERGVQIATSGDGPATQGDGRDLERMLRNLLDNAVRHSPKGGTVRLELSATEGALRITVADEGGGIPEAARARIFEPFYRGPKEQSGELPGAGLGLAIAREIARAHGGDVALGAEAEGAAGGAVFVVRLLAAQEEGGGAKGASAA